MLYKQVNPNQELVAYVARIVEALLRNLAFSMRQALEKAGEESIRDLRVNCLRLRHALRLFARAFPAKPARKIERRITVLRDLVAAVYACDMALQSLRTNPVASAVSARQGKRVAAELGAERRRSLRPLRVRLRKMHRSDALRRWRNRLIPAA